MKWVQVRGYRGIILIGVLTVVTGATPVAADRLTSPSYTIDTSVAAPFGGLSSSANYKLVTGGGEAINGMAANSSYKLGAGYVPQLAQSIQLSITQPSIALGTITPNVSKSNTLNATVATDAPGYSLAISQNANLTSGSNTIPALSIGTIASPISWTEGTTKGLGFAVTGGPSVPAKWGTSGNYKYAAIPSTPTVFFSRSGYTGGVNDSISLQPRVDVSPTQPTGSYSNIVTLTATLIP
jgi:hypothetical protein